MRSELFARRGARRTDRESPELFVRVAGLMACRNHARLRQYASTRKNDPRQILTRKKNFANMRQPSRAYGKLARRRNRSRAVLFQMNCGN
jgi:hypothetical protein